MGPHRADANLAALIESTEDIVWSVDLDYRLITFNTALSRAFERSFGVRAAVGMGPQDLLPPARAALFPPLYERVLSKGAYRAEYTLADGRTLELAFNPIVHDGETTGISVFGKDITERKTAEAALREAEERYRGIFEGALHGIYQASLDGKPLAANIAFAKMLGYESAEEVVSTITDSAHQVWLDPDGRSRFSQLLEEHKVVRGYECQFKRKDGTAIWVSLHSRKVCGEDGRALYDEGFIEDITERKRMEDALRESEEKYRDIFEGALEGICRVSLEGKPLAANPAVARMLGYHSALEFLSAITEMAHQVWLDPDERPRFLQLLEQHGVVRGYECQFKRKDGTAIWVSLNSRKVFGEDGRALYTEGFIEDITERKRIEDELRKSEERFAKVFRGNPAAMLLAKVEAEGNRIIDANEAFERISGYQREEVNGRTGKELGLFADPREYDEWMKQFRDGGRIRSFEFRVRRKNGDIGTGLISVVPMELDGEPWMITATIDITERKEAEARLQAQSERFQSIVEGTDAGYFRLGMDGCYEDANPAWLRMHGFTRREDAIGLHFSAVQVPDNKSKLEEIVEALKRGEPARSGELSRLRRDGTIGYQSFSASAVVDGGRVIGVEGFMIDITERKKIQALYELISENAADVIWIWDLEEGRCVYVSPSVEQLRGFSPEEILAQPLDEAMPDDNYRRALADVENRRTAVESGDEGVRIRTNEVVYVCKDGTTVATKTVTKLVSGAQGRVRYVIGVSRDITELKRAEAEKAKIEDQLRQAQKLESVGRLAAGVAHDFNNLLTVINGFSRLLLRGMEAGDPLREGLEEIHKAGERAAGLTQQLLAFSRKQMLQPRVLDLNHVVDEMRPMLDRLMGENVQVCVKLHPEATTIRADPHQLGQVLMNLAVNSRDAMPHGGRISIETGLVEWGESEIQSRPGAHAGPYVMLAVSDTGVGMSAETRGHIFEPFFTTKGVGKGTGLGLSTIHGIVEQSGGYVEAASEVGRGTTFQIYLPRVVDAQADSGRPEAATAVGGQETVLVVEDQAVVRRYAAAALRTFGYEVIEAENAEEALRVCERESERINLVLTDVVMPGLSGRELADLLKKRQPGIKVMFMSGYTDDAILHHGALEKDAEFIQKPFSPDQLAIKVREMLAAAGGPADAEALKSRR